LELAEQFVRGAGPESLDLQAFRVGQTRRVVRLVVSGRIPADALLDLVPAERAVPESGQDRLGARPDA